MPAGEILLTEGCELVIGRDEECDVRIDSRRISGRHAVLRPRDGRLVVEDLGSASGIRVNGEVMPRAELCPGDVLEIGGVLFELSDGSGEATPAAGVPSPEGLLEALTGLLAGEGQALADQLGGVLVQLLEGLGADRGAVLVEGDEGELSPLASRVRGGGPVDEATHVSRRLLSRALESREVLLLSEADTTALRDDFTSIPSEVRSILVTALPLPGGQGVLYLDGAIGRKRFAPRDASVLKAFAEAVGLAIRRDQDRRAAERRQAQFSGIQRIQLESQDLVADSACMRRVLEDVRKAAGVDVTVLLTGETGTGKELVAQVLHRSSPRAAGPFVAVNCAALPSELLESELFGHEKGAFSGATTMRQGRFELAEGGTLFLDEIGDLPASAQAKLLRALQERTITRVGGSEELPVDFRLISATHADLDRATAEGRFREDLLFRVAVMRIQLPPLYARGDDILEIARHYLRRFARTHGRSIAGISAPAEKLLLAHRWPGNIRELRNLIEQAVVREGGSELSAASLRSGLSLLPSDEELAGGRELEVGSLPTDLVEARRRFERAFLIHQLQAHNGNMTDTARAIGLARRNLYAKCEDLGIDYARYR